MMYELEVTMHTDRLEDFSLLWRDIMAQIREEYDSIRDSTFYANQSSPDGTLSFLLKCNEATGSAKGDGDTWDAERALKEMIDGKSVVTPSEPDRFYYYDTVTKTSVDEPFKVVMACDAKEDKLVDIMLPDTFRQRMGNKKFCERKDQSLNAEDADVLMCGGGIVQDVADGQIYFMQRVHNPFNGDTTCVTFHVNAVGDVEQVCLMEDFVDKFDGHTFIKRDTEEL